MITWIGLIAAKIISWLAKNLMSFFGLNREKAFLYAKRILIGFAVLVLLLVGGLLIKNCYIDRQMDKTAEIINELKQKDLQAEAEAKEKISEVNAAKVVAEKKDKKVENAEEAVEKIQVEKGVSKETAIENLCKVYPESELCKN